MRSAATRRSISPLSAKPMFGNLLVWKTIYESKGVFYVNAVRVGLGSRHYPGAAIAKLDAARDLPWLQSGSQQARDLERFRWFSGDYLAVAGDDTITDICYSLVPNEIAGLWGIILSPHAAPRLPDNHALRYMARRLLGDDPSLLPLVAGARQQQGLLQVLTDYCGNDEGDCQGCDFPL